MNVLTNVSRGDIWIADLGTYEKNGKHGSQQLGLRPVCVVSNDMCNLYSPTITIVPITSNLNKTAVPTHVLIGEESGLRLSSMVLAEQIQTIDKCRLKNKVGRCIDEILSNITKAVEIQVDPTIDYQYIQAKSNEIYRTYKFIDRYNNLPGIEDIRNSLNTTIIEFKAYCKQKHVDYKRFVHCEVAKEYKERWIVNE